MTATYTVSTSEGDFQADTRSDALALAQWEHDLTGQTATVTATTDQEATR